MSEDVAFHYPPDLFEMMVSTTILLSRSKPGLCLFFEGAGVPSEILKPLRHRISVNRSEVKMVEIARTAIEAANKMPGDAGLRTRRELVKRVTNFEAFEQCYEEKRHEAKSRVAEIRQFVNQHDRLTRLLEAQERELSKVSEQERAKRAAEAKRIASREEVAKKLAAFFTMTDAHKRGKLLEAMLNELFAIDEVAVRESFELRSENGVVLEQIDGVIELDGRLYLVEAKWWSENLGREHVASHMVRVFNRGHAHGIFIAHPGYSKPAIESIKTSNSRGDALFVLGDLEEVFRILRDDVSVTNWLKPKIHAAILDREPFVKYTN